MINYISEGGHWIFFFSGEGDLKLFLYKKRRRVRIHIIGVGRSDLALDPIREIRRSELDFFRKSN
jgi:hypothetical protein